MLLHFHSLGFVQSSSVSFFSLFFLMPVQYGNRVAEGTNGADYQTDELFSFFQTGPKSRYRIVVEAVTHMSESYSAGTNI